MDLFDSYTLKQTSFVVIMGQALGWSLGMFFIVLYQQIRSKKMWKLKKKLQRQAETIELQQKIINQLYRNRIN